MPAGSPLPQPSTLPEWATGGGAAITTPGPGTISSGSVPNTAGLAQYDNWRGRWTFKWLEWLKDIAHQAMTWTANHVFQGNVTVQGTATLAAISAVSLGLSGNLTVSGTATITGATTIAGALSAAAATIAGAISAASASIAGALTAGSSVFTGTTSGAGALRAVAGASTNALEVMATGAGTRGIVIDTGSGGTGAGITFSGANLARGELVLPLRTADPTSPVNGEVWLRHDLQQLCIQVAGITRRISMTP